MALIEVRDLYKIFGPNPKKQNSSQIRGCPNRK